MFHKEQKHSFWHFLLLVWAIIGLVYIVVDVKGAIDNQQAAREFGIRQGVENIVGQAMQLADQCEVIPLVMGDRQVDLVNTACLQTPDSGAGIAPAAEANPVTE